jgi:hypothetical protein
MHKNIVTGINRHLLLFLWLHERTHSEGRPSLNRIGPEALAAIRLSRLKNVPD